MCPDTLWVHLVFEGSYYKFPPVARVYFDQDGYLRLPVQTSGLNFEVEKIVCDAQTIFCLNLMGKTTDFSARNMARLLQLNGTLARVGARHRRRKALLETR